MPSSTLTFTDWLTHTRERVDQRLRALITDHAGVSGPLAEAMAYSTLLGGKRVRPALVIATADAFGVGEDDALLPACAVELLHTYSLVHDDLPAMDDDDLRRGQPSCHKAFDEATAILAGDALQTMAFELLTAPHPRLTAAQQLAMTRSLANASGARGMVMGQALDLAAEGEGAALELDALERIHRHKTGALIEASVKIGALCRAEPLQATQEQALSDYAQAIGLAFQVQDDILDIVSDTATLGKQQGADQARGKSTYPALLGLEGAKQKLAALHHDALHALDRFDARDSSKLAEMADFIVSRVQ